MLGLSLFAYPWLPNFWEYNVLLEYFIFVNRILFHKEKYYINTKRWTVCLKRSSVWITLILWFLLYWKNMFITKILKNIEKHKENVFSGFFFFGAYIYTEIDHTGQV